MIEFNLLPDVKLEHLKVERTKKQVFGISVAVAIISVVVLLLLFAALQLQNHQVSNNKKSISSYSSQLTGTADINKVLTIQNQLKTVVSLYNQTPDATRIYSYLPQLVPASVTIGHMTLDFGQSSLRINGTASSLETINTFADTLKFATYTSDTNTKGSPAFTSVQLTSFSPGSNSTYDFNIAFDQALFDRSQNIKLHVPSDYVSTRSFTQLPSDNLFNALPTKPGGQ